MIENTDDCFNCKNRNKENPRESHCYDCKRWREDLYEEAPQDSNGNLLDEVKDV